MTKNLIILVFAALLLAACASDPELIAKGYKITSSAEQDVLERKEQQRQESEIFELKKQTEEVKQAEKRLLLPKVYNAYGEVVNAVKVLVIIFFSAVTASAAFVVLAYGYTVSVDRIRQLPEPKEIAYVGHGRFKVKIGKNETLLDTREKSNSNVLGFLIGREKPERQGDMSIVSEDERA